MSPGLKTNRKGVLSSSWVAELIGALSCRRPSCLPENEAIPEGSRDETESRAFPMVPFESLHPALLEARPICQFSVSYNQGSPADTAGHRLVACLKDARAVWQ